MKNRFLGMICLLYSGIIIYVILFDNLKNFLAPQMQVYVKISLIPIFLIGIVMLFNNKVHYKFKISDLVLVLPLMMLFFVGDCRLTASFASNRTPNQNTENRVKTEEEKDVKETIELPRVEDETNNQEIDETIEKPNEEQFENEGENNLSEKYDFSNPYFNIVDSNYNELSNYITFAPKADKFKGETIKVRGFAIKTASYLPNEYFLIGKYAISCCVADAGVAGFIAKYDNSKIVQDKWYEIEGILEKGTDKDGYDIMYIKVINIREINPKEEEQYVYPCYSYDDGSCESISKYNLEY